MWLGSRNLHFIIQNAVYLKNRDNRVYAHLLYFLLALNATNTGVKIYVHVVLCNLQNRPCIISRNPDENLSAIYSSLLHVTAKNTDI